MRKTFSALLIVVLLCSYISPITFALENELTIATPSVDQPKNPTLEYPPWEDFTRLKSLIDSSFSPKKSNQSSCIANRTLCPTYKYTTIVEKAIKLIILKAYTGNEAFYARLFDEQYQYGRTESSSRESILARVPRASPLNDWKLFAFDSYSVSSTLLDASFWVDFSENMNSSSMLSAIETKIGELKSSRCQKLKRQDCYKRPLSNVYLPEPDELAAESIYWNRNLVKIWTLTDEFVYSIDRDPRDASFLNPPPPPEDIPVYTADFLTGTGDYFWYRDNTVFISTLATDYPSALTNCRIIARTNPNTSIRCTWKWVDIYKRSLPSVSQNIQSNTTYTLRYKKESYTLEEAKAELQKSPLDNNVTRDVFNSNNSAGSFELSCQSSTEYQTKSECTQAKTAIWTAFMALWAYYADTETYPDIIDKLNTNYIPKQEQLDTFKKYFTYTNTSSGSNNPSFEIRYIGKIWVNTSSSTSTESPLKRDYLALLSGATVPEIAPVFGYIPSESMVLYVRDPANLLDILNQKSNTTTRISGVDVSESIRKFMMTFFELENFDQIQSHLKNEMAIVVNNLDATAPDIVVILSEADRAALSPTAQARVVGSKDGWIFIANSKETLERFTGLSPEKSMKNAPDFQYVWTKKSQKIHDAFIFVGDEFFENILTFETYITHYRKYRDYMRLSWLQDLAWAYSDAFWRAPITFGEVSDLWLSTLTGEVLSEYSIADGIVTHRHIGTLKSINALPEARYDLSRISRAEIEDYKINVLKYRDVWRASLDPMGIVLNRYGDGMEIDFFMTPVPYFEDRDFQELYTFFANAGKESFSFINNPRIRMGLTSFVFGFDVDALRQSIAADTSIQSEFDGFNREVLDGKNILDYIGWEFAFSIGGLDPDIFDGWNIDKVDLYASIQVTNEEKWKELIDILRTKLLSEFDRSSGSDAEMIRGFLARPLIEEYNGKKIFYVEWLPFPFIGKIGFAYTFVDDFFMIGLNRSTIKKVIDTSLTNDTKKWDMLDAGSFSSGMLFATLFDGVTMSSQVAALYEKNKTSIPRYMRYMELDDLSRSPENNPILSAYYATQDRNRRLNISLKPFHYSLGALTISGDIDQISARLDNGALSTLTGTSLQTWENLRAETDFPQNITSEKGISLTELFAYKNLWDIVALALVSHLDTVMTWSESLFRNTTFGFSLTTDEIGFTWRIFREKDIPVSGTLPISENTTLYILFGIGIIVMIGGAIWVIIMRRRHQTLAWSLVIDSSLWITSPVVPADISPSPISPEIPAAEPSLPVTPVSVAAPVPSPVSDTPDYLTIQWSTPVVPPPVTPVSPAIVQDAPPVSSPESILQTPTPTPTPAPDTQK